MPKARLSSRAELVAQMRRMAADRPRRQIDVATEPYVGVIADLATITDPVERCAVGFRIFGKRYLRDFAPLVFEIAPFPA